MAPPSSILIGHLRFFYVGGAMHTSHPFTVGSSRVLKEPRERAEGARSERRGGWGAGRAEVTAGEASLDLPASFHRVGPSGGGSPPPSARRRGAEPDSGEATRSAPVALVRARARRALEQTVGHRERAWASGSAQTRTGVAGPPCLAAEGYCYPSLLRGQAGRSRVLVRRRPLCPDAGLSVRGGAGAAALQISRWRWSLLGCCGNRLRICILAG